MAYNGGIRFTPDIYYEIKEMSESDIKVLRNGVEVSGDDWGILRQLNNGTLTNLVVPDDITSIGVYYEEDGVWYSPFPNCESLESINLNKVTSIGGFSFNACTSLTSVEMPEVTYIGGGAFGNCESLTSVIIDNTIPPTLDIDVFENTSPDLKIYVPASAVDTYKAASGWSDYASVIVAIGS